MTQQSPSVDLLPCPFCPDGGKPKMETYQDGFNAICYQCSATVGFTTSETKEAAAKEWNTRANPTPAASIAVAKSLGDALLWTDEVHDVKKWRRKAYAALKSLARSEEKK